MVVVAKGEILTTVVTVLLQGIDREVEIDHREGKVEVGGAEAGEGGAPAEIAEINEEGATRVLILIEVVTITVKEGGGGAPEAHLIEGGEGEAAILLTEAIVTKYKLVLGVGVLYMYG